MTQAALLGALTGTSGCQRACMLHAGDPAAWRQAQQPCARTGSTRLCNKPALWSSAPVPTAVWQCRAAHVARPHLQDFSSFVSRQGEDDAACLHLPLALGRFVGQPVLQARRALYALQLPAQPAHACTLSPCTQLSCCAAAWAAVRERRSCTRAGKLCPPVLACML